MTADFQLSAVGWIPGADAGLRRVIEAKTPIESKQIPAAHDVRHLCIL